MHYKNLNSPGLLSEIHPYESKVFSQKMARKAIQIGHFTSNTKLEITSADETILEVLNYTSVQELMGKNLNEVILNTSRLNEQLRMCSLNRIQLTTMVEYQTKNGKKSNGKLTIQPIVRGKGEENPWYQMQLEEVPLASNIEAENILKSKLIIQEIRELYENSEIKDTPIIIEKTLSRIRNYLKATKIGISPKINDSSFETECNEIQKCKRKHEESISPLNSESIIYTKTIKESFAIHTDNNSSQLTKFTSHKSDNIYSDQKSKNTLNIPIIHESQLIGILHINHSDNKIFSEHELNTLSLYAIITGQQLIIWKQHIFIKKILLEINSKTKRIQEYSYITSHSLRTSIANLDMITYFIKENPTDRQFIDLLEKNVGSLNQSIQDVNHLLNFNNYYETSQQSPCNLFEEINKVLHWHQYTITKNRIKVSVEVDKSIYLQINNDSIDNIIHHAIKNAIRYGMTKNKRILTIRSQKDENHLKIQITDKGNGIDLTKIKDRLFLIGGKFHESNQNSNGLGLYLIRNVVQSLGGKVEIQSQYKKGTTLCIQFPLNMLTM